MSTTDAGRQLALPGTQSASPFLKWAGGKARLLAQFESLFPESWGSYHEPFLGGGAVFFHLAATGRIRAASLSDVSRELIECYIAIRDDVEAVLSLVREHEASHCRSHYYRVRGIDTRRLTPAERAARLIYLNKTCYNGLYRVNSRGQFNVPMGSYVNPAICDEENLRLVGQALVGVGLLVSDFRTVPDRVAPGDFVYLDPPYVPVSRTASFTSYSRNGFSEGDQRALARVFAQLAGMGCSVMLSNSDSPLVHELYDRPPWRIEKVTARRYINSKGSRRGEVTELVVLNY